MVSSSSLRTHTVSQAVQNTLILSYIITVHVLTASDRKGSLGVGADYGNNLKMKWVIYPGPLASADITCTGHTQGYTYPDHTADWVKIYQATCSSTGSTSNPDLLEHDNNIIKMDESITFGDPYDCVYVTFESDYYHTNDATGFTCDYKVKTADNSEMVHDIVVVVLALVLVGGLCYYCIRVSVGKKPPAARNLPRKKVIAPMPQDPVMSSALAYQENEHTPVATQPQQRGMSDGYPPSTRPNQAPGNGDYIQLVDAPSVYDASQYTGYNGSEAYQMPQQNPYLSSTASTGTTGGGNGQNLLTVWEENLPVRAVILDTSLCSHQ
ncbi:hypothetical protein KIPB_001401 [Kipferlia bialata]|uniref:CUB domain-containing protein n=1 Tax=Kipferlia bialata TaxID=797122 RepID=A0A9K3GFX4_9EUKA|nr:hypothetical protein KIPB_001401 [Kipferlia bialata]|eukprot:g1401.t1